MTPSIHAGSERDMEHLAWQLTLGGLFIFVVAAKLLLVSHYGSIVPYWDQWDGEAALLYKPYIEGTLTFDLLIHSHNEHRILLTRLLAIGLLELAGEWNTLLQMTVNAFLYGGFVLLFTRAIGQELAASERLPFAIATALILVLPFGWENTLAGFQSQFYLLLLLSALAFRLLIPSAAFSGRWFLGIALCVCAYFSLASGVFTLLAAVALSFLQILVGARARYRREWAALALMLAAAVMMYANVREVAAHAPLGAHSLAQWADAFRRIASAPLPFVGLLLHVPLVWFAVQSLRRPSEITPGHWFMLALAGWVLLQMVSLAYGRAVGTTSSRYLDLVIIAIPLDLAALRWLCARHGATPKRLFAVSTAWLLFASIGLAASAKDGFDGAAERGRTGQAQTQNVRAYLASGDIGTISDQPYLEVPYPNSERLAELLSDPSIRMTLPPELLPPGTDRSMIRSKLVLEGKQARGTKRVVKVLLRNAPALIGLGVGLWLVAGFLPTGRTPRTETAA